jgi:hypothetical protein
LNEEYVGGDSFLECPIPFIGITVGAKARVVIEEVAKYILTILPVPFGIENMRMPERIS